MAEKPAIAKAGAIINATTNILRLWRGLSAKRRRQFVVLAALNILSAGAEVASLGAVLPFLAVLSAPDALLATPGVQAIARAFGWSAASDLVLPLTLFFVATAVVGGLIRLFTLWVGSRLALAVGADLSTEIYRRTLHQPYAVHISRNSSEVISGVTTKADNVVFGVVVPSVALLGNSTTIVSIIAFLLTVNAGIALTACAAFGGAYALIVIVVRRSLARNSRTIGERQTLVVKAVGEGLGGIRDVLLDSAQSFYVAIHRSADRQLRRAQGTNVFIGQSPRFVMETLAMVLIALLAFMMSGPTGNIAASLPMLGALALAGQRLLPGLQQCFQAWSSVVGNQYALQEVLDLLDQPIADETRGHIPALEFRSGLRFEDVRFRYGPDEPWVLNGLTIEIAKGARVGIVGATGGGKSTALDLLMGLLDPVEGTVRIDGQDISSVKEAWRRSIAHVPQSIYLADTTIAENIAFGVSMDEVDMSRVKEAARRAQVADFIEGRPNGYGSRLGERGVQLSGGQRQRIGIARALYKQASVIVLDEATSALDNATEQAVMDAIHTLDRSLTVIMIAHRLSTVRDCDLILEIDGGRLVASGSFDELLEKSPSFRHMAGVSAREQRS